MCNSAVGIEYFLMVHSAVRLVTKQMCLDMKNCCRYCDNSIIEIVVDWHMMKYHNEKVQSCEFCHGIFSTYVDLKKHQDPEKLFKCRICSEKRYCTRFNRDKHMLKQHQQKVHDCNFCNKIFYTHLECHQHCEDCPKK